MENIAVKCPNGHKLTGPSDLAGRKVRCPKCNTSFVLTLPPKQVLTDTAVMKLLGDVTPVPPPPEETPKSKKVCARCHHSISINANVCEHCQCYVGAMPSFLTQMIAEGKSIIGFKHESSS